MDQREPDQIKLEVQSDRRSAARDEPGYTKFDNYFLDKVMHKAGGVEWKVICTVIRDTRGWQSDEAEITIERFIEMTGAKRSRLFEAITAACQRGVIRRPEQRSFRFQPIRRGNLHEVPKRDRRRRNQERLPFAESENRTLENPKIGPTQSENRTLVGPLLISVKERSKEIETHTREAPVENPAVENSEGAAPRVCVNQIDRSRYKSYARAQARIEDPNAWATTAERTRQWDSDVLEWEAEQRLNEATRCAEGARREEAPQERRHLAPGQQPDVWPNVVEELRCKMNPEKIDHWFSAVKSECVDRVIYLRAPNHIVKDWIVSNCDAHIAEAMKELGLSGFSICWMGYRTSEAVEPAKTIAGQPAIFESAREARDVRASDVRCEKRKRGTA